MVTAWWDTSWLRGALGGALVASLAGGCLDVPTHPGRAPDPLQVGESREVEVYAVRLDVDRFEEVVTKADILGLPTEVRRNLWLLDLDVTGNSGSPRLIDNAIAAIRELDPEDATLTQAERNMVTLLAMSPDTFDLRGTNLETLLGVAPRVGIPPEEVLADAIGIGVTAPFLSNAAVTEAIVTDVIGTHPEAAWRPGPKTVENPSGRVPVPPGSLPITLEDAATDMQNLVVRYGEYRRDGQYHPGFVVGTSGAKVLGDDFRMILRASVNALPFKGVDLTDASRGNVGSVGRDGPLFDFTQPDWLTVEGLVDDVVIDEMTFQILEHPDHFTQSTTPLPHPTGDAAVWKTPPWTVERLVAGAGRTLFAGRNYEAAYALTDEPLFTVSVVDGWIAIAPTGDLGDPPPPSYLWDVLLEVAQARLHDGGANAPAEGEAHVTFTLKDVPLGVHAQAIEDAMRNNLEADASALSSASSVLLGQASGAPDFYHFQPRSTAPAEEQGDWLFFITQDDIVPRDDGTGRRIADYPAVGFFADPALSVRVSSRAAVDGDVSHEKVRVVPGDTVYCGDDAGSIYQIDVVDAPSSGRLLLRVTRVA